VRGKKSYEDEDSRWLQKSNKSERRNGNKANRKHDKRVLSDYTCLDDALEDEDDLLDDYDLA
jgi:hypothetical protein